MAKSSGRIFVDPEIGEVVFRKSLRSRSISIRVHPVKGVWGRDFSLYHFHKFVLETGPSDFNGLHDILPSYSPDNLRPKEES